MITSVGEISREISSVCSLNRISFSILRIMALSMGYKIPTAKALPRKSICQTKREFSNSPAGVFPCMVYLSVPCLVSVNAAT